MLIVVQIINLTYKMYETNFLKIYLRQTNGVGEKVIINPLITIRQLYNFASQIFSLHDKSFDIYFKGEKLEEKGQATMQELKIQSESILHVHKKVDTSNRSQSLQLRVFCQGSLYSYATSKNSTFSQLKIQIANMLGCSTHDITITYLGKMANNNHTLRESQIKDKDLISVIINTSQISRLSQRSVSWLKPKITESLTFANSDQVDPNYEPFSKTVMRKSSMKSSHESRQLRLSESKKILQVIRPKSQLSRSNNKVQTQNEAQKNQFAWLSNQKMIQTESINFDQPQEEQGPECWMNCQVQLNNISQTKFYTLDCTDDHNLEAVIKTIKKCERMTDDHKITVTFGDQVSQQMAETGKSMLFIAKANRTKILRNIIFSY